MMVQANPIILSKKINFFFSSQPIKPEEPKQDNEQRDEIQQTSQIKKEQDQQKQNQSEPENKKTSIPYWCIIVAGVNILMFQYYNKYLSSDQKETFLERYSLSYKNIYEKGYFDTLLTYSLVNITAEQQLFNILVLGFAGRFIENSFGSKLFMKYYLGGILLGGLIMILSQSIQETSYQQIGPMTGLSSVAGGAVRLSIYPLVYSGFWIPPIMIFPALLVGVSAGMMVYSTETEDKSAKLGCFCFGLFYPFLPFFLNM